MIWIIVIGGIVLVAFLIAWPLLAISSRESREEERQQMKRDIAEILEDKHGS